MNRVGKCILKNNITEKNITEYDYVVFIIISKPTATRMYKVKPRDRDLVEIREFNKKRWMTEVG